MVIQKDLSLRIILLKMQNKNIYFAVLAMLLGHKNY